MKRDVEPLLQPVEIAALRPTQMTVGYREVSQKRVEWRRRSEEGGSEFLGHHMVPAVLGPKQRHYLIDNHHLVRALYEERVEHVLVRLVADLSTLPKPSFWTFMDNRNWLHPYDAAGKRKPLDRLPKAIDDLADDPYRSLAGALRRAGGYGKDATPYSEFLWADFLRRQVDLATLERDFQKALVQALAVAHGPDASYLPGWCGPDE